MAGYTAELATRVTERFAGRVEQATVEEIYHFSKEVALESYKNGLATAKRKSTPRSPAWDKGSALQNGKLRRVA